MVGTPNLKILAQDQPSIYWLEKA